MIPEEQFAEVLERSAKGEGVAAVLREFGMDKDEVWDWLKEKPQHLRIVAAKKLYQEFLSAG